MGRGRQTDVAGLTALAAWSGIDPVDFTGGTRQPHEPIVAVGRLLRQDPRLDDDGAKTLEAIVKTAYERLKRKLPSD